jgi:predicted DsbA family dithiol-disulfide isomerase
MLQDHPSISKESVTTFHEAVFEAYFTGGIFPDKDGVLKATRNMKGKDKEEVYAAIDEFYNDGERLYDYSEQVKYEAQEGSARGVTGVPFFEFNGRPAFSGAQSISTFARHLVNATGKEEQAN